MYLLKRILNLSKITYIKSQFDLNTHRRIITKNISSYEKEVLHCKIIVSYKRKFKLKNIF